MVQVYLPMGYPLQTGVGFANVLYQGSIVRLYQIPKDPRTDVQLENRRFLSDTSRMRSNLGTWARALCKLSMGTKWGSVLYQAIKADVDSCWSNAVSEWESLLEGERVPWRNNAPYQATFNDQGLIFFALTRVLAYALQKWGGYGWACAPLFGDDALQALDWWLGNAAGQVALGGYDDLELNLQEDGAFQNYPRAECWMGTCRLSSNASNQRLKFIYLGKKIVFSFLTHPAGGMGNIYFNGVYALGFNSYSGSGYAVANTSFTPSVKGLHVVELVRSSGTINLDSVTVY